MSETSLENLFSLDHLSPTEFEDLCFDLLKALGYEDISWRKGTNSDASPADGGRDIECVFEYSDPDGSKFRQKWFVECKHHKNAVPAEKLNSAMTAALSQNIDVLLIATSGFLSNPAKDSLRNFSNNHQGTAKRIKIWEKKDFEYLIFKYSFLMSKYKIGPQFPFLSRIHPLHAHFIDSINISSELNHFFKVIEDIPEDERDEIFSLEYWIFINPKLKKSINKNDKLGNLLLDDVTYENFKVKFIETSKYISSRFMIRSMIMEAANRLLTQSDYSALDRFIEAHKGLAEIYEEHPEWKNKAKSEIELRNQMLKGQELYKKFCETVILNLILAHVERFQKPNPPK